MAEQNNPVTGEPMKIQALTAILSRNPRMV
jgi:hypothetical protein